MYINKVQIAGRITTIHPPKDYPSGDTMLIIEVETKDELASFTHRVSLVNEVVDYFFHNFDTNMFIRIEGKLMPRPMNKDNPNGQMFFDIRCMSCEAIEPEKVAQEAVKEDEQLGVAEQDVSVPVVSQEVGSPAQMVCSPSLPVTVFKSEKNSQYANQMGGSLGFDNFGLGDDSIEYLNGAPVDRSLPFYPQNGVWK